MLTARAWAGALLGLICLALFPPALLGGGPLLIGEIDPLTGKLARHGREIHEGIVYAVEEANRAGGVSGRKLELVTRDDQSQAQVALGHVEELITRRGVLGLTGGYVDSLVAPIAIRARAHRVPYVASASIQKGLTGNHNPYFFRVSRLSGFVEPIIEFITGSLRPKRVGIIFASTPGSTEFARDIKDRLGQAGITVPVFEKFRPGLPSFFPIISKMRVARVEMVVSGGFFPDHTLFIRQLAEEGAAIKGYLGPWGIAYRSFIEEMAGHAEYVYTTAAWLPGAAVPGARELSERFVNSFTVRFGKSPTTTNMHGYASAFALIEAIRRAAARPEGPTRKAVQRELQSLDIMTPMGRVKFDAKGDPLFYSHVIVQVQKGGFVVVYPKPRATGKHLYPAPGYDRR